MVMSERNLPGFGDNGVRWSLRSAWWVGVAVCAVVGITGRVWPAVVAFQLAVLGFVLTWWLVSTVTTDRVCLRLIVWAYAVKILLAAVLYYASLSHWAIFEQYTGGAGFWIFAHDAQAHDSLGRRMTEAWSGRGSFPPIEVLNWSYFLYVGLIYHLLGTHPLNVLFLNAWHGTVLVLAGLMLMQRFGTPLSSRRLGVAVLAFWPSLVLWFTQPMKDPLVLTLIMVGLSVVVMLLEVQPRHALRFFGLAGLLGLVLVTLLIVRSYTGVAFGGAVITACSLAALQGLRRGGYAVFGRFLAVVVGATVVLFSARQVDLPAMFTPSQETSEIVTGLEPSDGVFAEQPQPFGPGTLDQPELSAALVDQLTYIARVGRPDVLDSLRQGFVSTGGYSMMDAEVRIRSFSRILAYLPRGLSVAFLAPFPSQWFDLAGSTRWIRGLAAIEMVLIYLLLIGFGGRVCQLLMDHRGLEFRRFFSMPVAVILLFVVLVAVPMSLTVANVGTLFRLRLQFLLPLWILACLVDTPEAYRSTAQRLRLWWPRRGGADVAGTA